VSAPLADPNARPNLELVPAIEVVLRVISLNLISGDTSDIEKDVLRY
jgi:hypothetical protein